MLVWINWKHFKATCRNDFSGFSNAISNAGTTVKQMPTLLLMTFSHQEHFLQSLAKQGKHTEPLTTQSN